MPSATRWFAMQSSIQHRRSRSMGGSMRSRGIAVRRIWLAMLALGLAASFASGQALPPLDQPSGKVAPDQLPVLIPPTATSKPIPVATSVVAPKIAKSPNPPPAIPARSLPIAGSDIDPLKPLPIPPIKAAAKPSRLRAGPANFQTLASKSSPLVAVELIVPPQANVGQVTPFELVVHNRGKSAVYQVRLEQELPPGMRYLSRRSAG